MNMQEVAMQLVKALIEAQATGKMGVPDDGVLNTAESIAKAYQTIFHAVCTAPSR